MRITDLLGGLWANAHRIASSIVCQSDLHIHVPYYMLKLKPPPKNASLVKKPRVHQCLEKINAVSQIVPLRVRGTNRARRCSLSSCTHDRVRHWLQMYLLQLLL